MADGRWLIGTIAFFFGSVFFLASVQWFRERNGEKESLAQFSNGVEESGRKTLVSRPDSSIGELLQPMLAIVALYQIPSVILFVLFANNSKRIGLEAAVPQHFY